MVYLMIPCQLDTLYTIKWSHIYKWWIAKGMEELVNAYFKILSQNMSGGNEENNDNLSYDSWSMGQDSNPNLSSTNQKCLPLNCSIFWKWIKCMTITIAQSNHWSCTILVYQGFFMLPLKWKARYLLSYTTLF